jgi:hypothetical protein
VEVRHGRLRLASFAPGLTVTGTASGTEGTRLAPERITVHHTAHAGRSTELTVRRATVTAGRARVTLAAPVTLERGDTLAVTLA